MSIVPILPAEIPVVWDHARVALEKAFIYSLTDNIDNHYFNLVNDLEQLWRIDKNAWGLTAVHVTKVGNCIEFIAVAGNNLDEWLDDYVSIVELWGKKNGCVRAIFGGRLGWARKLKDYKIMRVSCAKEL